MKYAWIENEKIRDVCHGIPSELYHPDIAVFYDTEVPDDAVNNDGWVNGVLVKPEPIVIPPPEPTPVPVPLEISDRQFWHQLALAGMITKTEAVAAVNTGTLPAQIEGIVASLPEDPEFESRMYFAARVYQRSHPFVDQMGAVMGLTSAMIDDLWRAAAVL